MIANSGLEEDKGYVGREVQLITPARWNESVTIHINPWEEAGVLCLADGFKAKELGLNLLSFPSLSMLF